MQQNQVSQALSARVQDEYDKSLWLRDPHLTSG